MPLEAELLQSHQQWGQYLASPARDLGAALQVTDSTKFHTSELLEWSLALTVINWDLPHRTALPPHIPALSLT
jgi:hypothetical protein